MEKPAKRRAAKRKTLIDMIPKLLESALADSRDFVLTFETDEETGKQTVHAMTGTFVSPCMLRKLIGQAESQRDEGATLISRKWVPARTAKTFDSTSIR
ncbi:MAG: hypothetical protein CVV32_06750 [Methanomicrobiales archaeon HGW-Methanomicrobiales-3]|jgi:hypothetical protein|nr:MAG: hypothetical protein CVV32_06750 [Methanomicrobiales archaeon HGW-Methanomicrobiales-3]